MIYDGNQDVIDWLNVKNSNTRSLIAKGKCKGKISPYFLLLNMFSVMLQAKAISKVRLV